MVIFSRSAKPSWWSYGNERSNLRIYNTYHDVVHVQMKLLQAIFHSVLQGQLTACFHFCFEGGLLVIIDRFFLSLTLFVYKILFRNNFKHCLIVIRLLLTIDFIKVDWQLTLSNYSKHMPELSDTLERMINVFVTWR